MKEMRTQTRINWRRCNIFLLGLLILSKGYSQVNLQTGSATFNLPMFGWQDNKSRLTSQVAISYNSGSGLKVSDIASNVGQGWSLVAGGVITRLQVGEPDDQVAQGTSAETDLTKYPPGYLYATIPVANGCPVALTKYPLYKEKNQEYVQHNSVAEDKQLDYFAFQFNGKAGMFVLDKASGNTGVSLGDSKMKITFQKDMNLASASIRTSITSFSIQDVDGLIYTFSQQGLTKFLNFKYCDENLIEKRTQPKFEDNKGYHQAAFESNEILNPWVIDSWDLTQIKDPLTQRTINFTYEVRNISTPAGNDISYNQEGNYIVIAHKKSITKTPELSSITYPDGHAVNFIYDTKFRFDLNGEQALSKVDITYQGRYLSQYKLNTTYFILNRYGIPQSTYQKSAARLCLKSVQKIGVDLKEETPPYIFDYYLGSNSPDDFVPPPFFYAKDIWGYFNGYNSKGWRNEEFIDLTNTISQLNVNKLKGLCSLKEGVSGVYLNPNPGFAKNGLLKQIIFPTGGTLGYEYTQNRGVIDYTEVNVGGVHVSQTSATDGGASNGCLTPLITQYNYVLSSQGSPSSLWGIEKPVNTMTLRSYYNPEKRYYKWSLSSCQGFGCCDYKYKYPGILSQQQAVDLAGFQKTMEALAPYLGALSVVTTIMDVTTLFMANPTPLAIIAVVVDVVASIINIVFTCFHDFSKTVTSTVFLNYDLNGVSPLPTQFKRVEVVEGSGTIGKTIHEFTNSDDYPIWEPLNTSFSAKQRFAPWAYGLPKLTSVYDASGNKIKETENVYNFNTVYLDAHCFAPHLDRRTLLKKPLQLKSVKCLVKKSSSQRITDWRNPGIYNTSFSQTPDENMEVESYDLYTGRVELNASYERTYPVGDPTKYVQHATEYVYNDENYEPKIIRTQQSNGKYLQKNLYYSIDFVKNYGQCRTLTTQTTTNPEIIRLVQNNILSMPVEVSEQLYDPQYGFYKYLSDKATLFTSLTNGDIKPAKTIEGRFSQPGDRASIWESDIHSGDYYLAAPLLNPANPAPSFYKQTQAYTYDPSGNLIGVKDEGGRSVANVYEYNDKYVAASVVNADPVIDNVGYTSFESNGFGGWSFSGGGPVYSGNAITGSRSFVLVSNTLTKSLTASKTYTLSFWTNTSGFTVTGGSQTKSGPTLNGFTYYEYDVPQGTATVSISGTADIDELRIYPKVARMRSVTYDPLIGKTSECDENNRITYYEYDNLGRLRFIKDEGKNIIKMYEYNNVSRRNGCPGIYYNRQTTEYYTKSNCGSGYIGGQVPYTVPANKYSSTISQEDADAQVDNELLQYGQAAADASNNCIQIFYNAQQQQTVTSESCDYGYEGGNVTYVVPANKYWSTVSVEDANNKALEEITANAQAYANSPAYRVCVPTASPQWEWDSDISQCRIVSGQVHEFVKETDLNPNSGTYGKTRWSDVGPTPNCTTGLYYNTQQQGTFQKTNCPSGQVGNYVTYIVPEGTYSSSVSVDAANQLAINDVNANGQTYANNSPEGTCTTTCSFSAAPGFSLVTSSITSSGGSVSFYIVFYSQSGTTNWYNSNHIANINGGCWPSSNRTMTLSENDRTWQVIVNTYGNLTIQLMSGTPPSGSATIGLTGGSFNL